MVVTGQKLNGPLMVTINGHTHLGPDGHQPCLIWMVIPNGYMYKMLDFSDWYAYSRWLIWVTDRHRRFLWEYTIVTGHAHFGWTGMVK